MTSEILVYPGFYVLNGRLATDIFYQNRIDASGMSTPVSIVGVPLTIPTFLTQTVYTKS